MRCQFSHCAFQEPHGRQQLSEPLRRHYFLLPQEIHMPFSRHLTLRYLLTLRHTHTLRHYFLSWAPLYYHYYFAICRAIIITLLLRYYWHDTDAIIRWWRHDIIDDYAAAIITMMFTPPCYWCAITPHYFHYAIITLRFSHYAITFSPCHTFYHYYLRRCFSWWYTYMMTLSRWRWQI